LTPNGRLEKLTSAPQFWNYEILSINVGHSSSVLQR
jgi:hypothetical protein